VLLRHPQVLILTDDIYEHLVYDGFEFATMAQVEPALYDRTLTMNGLSKAYAMTGWRIGYAGGPEWLIKAMAKVMGQSTSNPCSISQWAGVAALNGPHDFITKWNTAYRARRNFVVAALNGAAGLASAMPDGAFYAYPDCGGLLGKRSADGRLLQTDIDVAAPRPIFGFLMRRLLSSSKKLARVFKPSVLECVSHRCCLLKTLEPTTSSMSISLIC